MCEQCALAVEWYYPMLTDEERVKILMSATSFPFGNFEYIERQLSELIANTDGTLEGALCYAQKKMDEDFDKWKNP